MVLQNSRQLDRVFHALSNPTRRLMLRQLAAGKHNIGELAEPLRMSFAGAAKHVRVLEEAGLLRRQVQGREHMLQIEAKPLANAEEWIRYYKS
jgi:DNA-binding transcriptional ArsR family regulator